MAPVALDALMERARLVRDEARWLVAAQRADFWNVNRDPDKHPELFTPADFMPAGSAGASKQNQGDYSMQEFIDQIQRGEKFEVTPEGAAAFRLNFESRFDGIVTAEREAGEVVSAGPLGKPERFATNAIAGENPRRGVS